jgi:hypothetical protein
MGLIETVPRFRPSGIHLRPVIGQSCGQKENTVRRCIVSFHFISFHFNSYHFIPQFQALRHIKV